MSAWSEAAETLKAKIESLQLKDVAVVVDRQLNIASQVELMTAKAGAVAVVILWAGCRIKGNIGNKVFVTEPNFDVRCYASGIVEEATGVKLDDVIEKILPAVHEWSPAGVHLNREFKITGDVDLVPDKKYLIYTWPMECGSVVIK